MHQPFFTVVMASLLTGYPGAATDRETKFYRAVDSLINQTFTDWELIIVADGCQKTWDIVTSKYKDHLNIDCIMIPKQKTFAGQVRNKGIAKANGQWITYLDTDDYIGKNHLQILYNGISKTPLADWVYYNDQIPMTGGWKERFCNMDRKGQHGTANITHKNGIGAVWMDSTYDHDFHFVNHLKKIGSGYKIGTPEYFVCHIPKKWDI